ncbi:MAG: hypothetical protein DRJ42_23790 [Deltaproteobacteria bacterium]|nr:MAG: hypothetical protein DRJ42_23790 [Deltaproteobacteria bacterium]
MHNRRAITAWFLLLALPGLSACSTTVDIPDGVFACTTVADCPETFECRGDGLCYAVIEVEMPGDSSVDAGADAGADGG